MTLKRKTPAEGFSQNETLIKKARSDVPIHSRRVVVVAQLSWISGKGEERTVTAKLLVDSGATGPILCRNFVAENRLPKGERQNTIRITNVNGDQIPGAGRYIVPNLGISVPQ